jgi:hypothetical protein
MTTEPRPPSWAELVTLMVHGPDLPMRGLVRSHDPEEEGWFAYVSEEPVLAGVRGGVESDDELDRPRRVWRDGARVRIEEAGGRPNLIADEDTVWQFQPDEDVPVAAPRRRLMFVYGGTSLLARRTAEGFLGDDSTRPTGPVGTTTFLGRRAWTVELAPPRHKPHPIQLVVDAETGLLLQKRNDGFGMVEEWVELTVGEDLDPALFTWTGPSRPIEDRRAADRAEHEADLARRAAWFAERLGPAPVRAELELAPFVHDYDDETGAFHASLGDIGSLARRPRSPDPWDPGFREVQHRWSTGRWDWALSFDEHRLTPEGLEALKRRLGD